MAKTTGAMVFQDRVSTAVADLLYECIVANDSDQLKRNLGLELTDDVADSIRCLRASELGWFAKAIRGVIKIDINNPSGLLHAAQYAAENGNQDALIEELIKNDAPLPFLRHFFGVYAREFARYRARYGMSQGPRSYGPNTKLNPSKQDQLLELIGALLRLTGKGTIDDLTADQWLSLSRQTGISLRLLWSFYNDQEALGRIE